jgi:RNA polymerase sigma-70 factor (ECF subfamily)
VDRKCTDVPALIAAARKGQPDALNHLLGLYRNYLQLLAYSGLSGPFQGKADPSDLVQDTLLDAYRDFLQFSGADEQAFTSWLRQIVSRNLIDFVRRYRSAARDVAREESADQVKFVARLCNLGDSVASSPSQSAQRRELGVLVADALSELSGAQREAIVLRTLQDLSWAEVGRRMGRSEEAVRKLWTRALVNLKPLIESRL